jgi:hypothetical protein
VARILILSTAQGALSLTALVSYKAGWDDALSSGTRLAESESAKELSSSISGLHVEGPLTTHSALRDDAAWESFMLGLAAYRDRVDSLERGQE